MSKALVAMIIQHERKFPDNKGDPLLMEESRRWLLELFGKEKTRPNETDRTIEYMESLSKLNVFGDKS